MRGSLPTSKKKMNNFVGTKFQHEIAVPDGLICRKHYLAYYLLFAICMNAIYIFLISVGFTLTGAECRPIFALSIIVQFYVASRFDA